jgi:hypothetical protein
MLASALLALPLLLSAAPKAPMKPTLASTDKKIQAVVQKAKTELLKKHGEGQKARIERGVDQVAAFWRTADGDEKAFLKFVSENFAGDEKTLDGIFQRFEENLETVDGHLLEINRDLAKRTVVEMGPILEVDKLFGSYDASAHFNDDMFAQKIAFVALLNFPLSTLQERLDGGEKWSRRQWAESRIARRFQSRVPASVAQGIAQASADAELYIAEYNLWMHHLVDDKGERLWPKGLKLITHWNLRDDLKASYATKDGLPRQRAIAKVMERIVTESIPRAAVNNPAVDWNPVTNAVKPAPEAELESGVKAVARVEEGREPDTRYERLLACYKASRAADPFSPSAPSHILRKFEVEREIPEARMESLLKEVLESPLVPRLAAVIEKRLGRKLEPFDIWYDGFRPRAKYSEAELDAITKKKYPTAEAYKADIPRLLEGLGFAPEKAKWLASHIVVDPSRGAGHALGSQRRGDDPHLRTRVEPGGMDYKGYNIAVHEMGHNVEQIFSLYEVDHLSLGGVPNTAFTEALAFVFQARDLELLGLARPDAESQRLKAMNELWMTYEIAGVALVDMAVWHWMYDHPDASAAQLREATVAAAKDVWNRYYAPVFGVKDVPLLGIYSHMVSSFLYLPDYPIGHVIANQVEEQFAKGGKLSDEFERMAKFGSVTPDLWMKNATGEPLSAKALLRAAETALSTEK